MAKRSSLFLSIYVAPSPASKGFPSKITPEVFSALADLPLTAIFGHYEMDWDRSAIFTELDLAQSHGLAYYPRDLHFNDFLSDEATYCHPGIVPFSQRDPQEQEREINAFLDSMADYLDHPACPGVFLFDEVGAVTFPSIGKVYAAFHKRYPTKEFRWNEANYCLSDDKIRLPGESLPLTGKLAAVAANRFHRYDRFFDHLFSAFKTEAVSADFYPYLTLWPSIPAAIHRALFEENAYFADLKRRTYPFEYDSYIQVGHWDASTRAVNEAEMALQINVPLAYGHEGLVFFPGIFPNEWLEDPVAKAYREGGCALLDAHGHKTIYYQQIQHQLKQARLVYNQVLSQSEFLGVSARGEFAGGFRKEDALALKDGECIFAGELPDYCLYEPKEIASFASSSQILISTFYQEGHEIYFLVNTSLIQPCSAKLTLKHPLKRLIQSGKVEPLSDVRVILSIAPGASVLLA